MKFRTDIEGLRGLSVLAVVLYHFQLVGISGGFVGVDVFFVISGYLITSIVIRDIDNRTFTLTTFYERRIRRLVPALFLMIAVVFAAGYLTLLPNALEALAESGTAAVLFVSNHHFWGTGGYFDPARSGSPLMHTWSLAIEEQFYIVYPVLLMAIAAVAARSRLKVIIVCAIVSFGIALWGMNHHPNAAFYLAPARAWELMTGAIVAMVSPRLPLSRLCSEAIGLAGLAMILIGAVMYADSTPFPGMTALLPVTGAALVILGGSNGALPTTASRVLSLRFIRGLGSISYSLYLWHWPILLFATARLPYEMTPQVRTGLVMLSLLVSYASWRFVERPFRGTEGILSRRSIFSLAAISAGLLILVAFSIRANDGYPARYDFNLPEQDFRQVYREGSCLLQSETAVDSYKLSNCRAGHAGAPSNILVWGDSHAAHLIPGLDEIGKRDGFQFYQASYGGCPPLAEPVVGDDQCGKFQQSIMDILSEDKTISTVVISANWGVYAARGDIVSAIEETIGAIRALDKDVVFVGPGPNYEIDVPSLFALSLSRFGEWRPDKFPPRRNQALQESLRRLVARTEVRSVFPYEVFCEGDACEVIDASSGNLIIWDTNHLTIEGSRRLADRLALLVTRDRQNTESRSGADSNN